MSESERTFESGDRIVQKQLVWNVAVAAALVTACEAPREAVMEEVHVPGLFTRHTAEIGVISTGASHRVVTFRVNEEARNRQPRGAFCAEPPPDAAEAIASRLAAEFKATIPVGVQSQVSNVGLSGAYERALATAVMALGRRSQGLQWARDQTTAACQDFLNGRIDELTYIRWRETVMRDSQKLIEREIQNLPTMTTNSVSAPVPQSGSGSRSGSSP